jgi:peptidoglycan/LPS O-acetylase OafA/YrhL
MDWMYLVYFSLGLLIFFGARSTGKGVWNEEYTSLKQTKILEGITALGIALHHMAQKTCAPWLQRSYIVNGLDFFIPMGYMFVAVFLFCSGLGLYKSFKTKPDYLK